MSLFTEDTEQTIYQKELFESHFRNFPYNEEQRLFIESPLEHSKLLGIPGGGKTQSILGKIFHHYLQGDFLHSKHYMILTFSRKTNIEFLHKCFLYFRGDESLCNQFFHTKNIRTLQSLANRINQEYISTDIQETSQDISILSAYHHLHENPEKLDNIEELCEIRAIFLDEAQDLSKIQYDFIVLIQQYFQIPILMIGDPNQSIYQFQKGSDIYLLNHIGKTYHLIQNYRSTPPIISFINYFRPWAELTPRMIPAKEFSKEECLKPIIFTGTVEEILQDISKNISLSSSSKEDIAIIGPVKKSKPVLDTYKNIGLSLFVSHFQKNHIPFKKHYEDSMEDSPSLYELESTNRETNHVNLYTIHGAKGLEFEEVYLVNFHTYSFGIMPTEEKYKELKYLWYVGMSRAKKRLRIYIEERKTPWYELKMCPNNYYHVEGKRFQFPKKIEFREEIEPLYYEISYLMKSKDYFDEEVYYQFEKYFTYKLKREKLFELDADTNLVHRKEYQKLYHIFLQFLFIFEYSKKHGKTPEFIQKVRVLLENVFYIPKKYQKGYVDFKKRYPKMNKEPLCFQTIYENRNKMKWNEEQLFQYLHEQMDGDMTRIFYMILENDISKFPKKEMEDSIYFLEIDLQEKNQIWEERHDKHLMKHLFRVSFFVYQFDEEVSYLWNYDFKEEIESLQMYIQKIRELVQKEENEFSFHQFLEHPHLPIQGEIDMIQKTDSSHTKLIQLKFNKNIYKKNVFELLLYGNMINTSWKSVEMEFWNFLTGDKVILQLNHASLPSHLSYLYILSQSIKKKLQNMIFVYDAEMIGMNMENAEFVQLYFEDFTNEECIFHKYILPERGENINSYYNRDILIEKGEIMEDMKEDIQVLFDMCEKPRFISHNAGAYDQYIFQKSGLFKNAYSFIMIDTRKLLKNYMDGDIDNLEIMDIFEDMFGYVKDETNGKEQVNMLKMILKEAKIGKEEILMIMNST